MLVASLVIAVVALVVAAWAILPIVLGRPHFLVDFARVPIHHLAPEPISRMGPGEALGATVGNRPLRSWIRMLGVRRGTSTRVVATFDIADGYTGRVIHEGVRALFIDQPAARGGADMDALGSPTVPTRMVLVGRHGQITFSDGGEGTLPGGPYTCLLRDRANEYDIEKTATEGFQVGPDGASWNES